MNKALQLFWTFFKIGSFTFGGGFAMVPLIQREVIDRKNWVERSEFLELLALAQSAPGPIALNMAVFVGYRVAGYRGAFSAVGGVILPSFAVILLIAMYFQAIRTNPTVDAIFKGISPAVVALIIAPIINLSRGIGWVRGVLAVIAALAVWYFGFSPVYLIVAGAAGGLLYGMRMRKSVPPKK